MAKLYLDIDGVLLTAKHTQAAPGVEEFVDFITQRFDCYWLTTHCKGDSAPAIRYLTRFLLPATLEKLHQGVQPTNWETLKIEAIDLTSGFYWLDDQPFQSKIAYLQAHGVADRLLIVDLNRSGQLLALTKSQHYAASSYEKLNDSQKDYTACRRQQSWRFSRTCGTGSSWYFV